MFVLCLFESEICEEDCEYRDRAFMMQRFLVIWLSSFFASDRFSRVIGRCLYRSFDVFCGLYQQKCSSTRVGLFS